MTNEKQHAHELIEQLPQHQLSAVVGLLEAMIDPVSRKLAAAPIDEEAETEDERRAVEQSKEWLRQRGGKGIPHEEVLRDFGLTTEDFHRMARGKKDWVDDAARADVRRIDRETAMRILGGLARFLLTKDSDTKSIALAPAITASAFTISGTPTSAEADAAGWSLRHVTLELPQPLTT